MSRSFPYRRAPIPNITEPVYDEDGFATTQMRAWMEAVEIQRGPTLDAAYDLSVAVDEAASDGVLTPNEKRDIVPQIQALLNEESGLVAEADKLGLSTTSYENAINQFQSLLNGLTDPTDWDDLSGKTTLSSPVTFINRWQAVIQAANALKRQIESFIPQAVLDTVLTPAEKRIVVPQIVALQNEEASLVTAATNLGISTTAYEDAQDDLASYLATLTSPVDWDDRSDNTDIAAPNTFVARQQAVIEARDALLAAISEADVNWPRVVNVNVTETQISDNSISTPKLIANSVTADKIQINSLSALTAKMGNLTVNGVLNVTSGGQFRANFGATAYAHIGSNLSGGRTGILVRDQSGDFPVILDVENDVFRIQGATLVNATLTNEKLVDGTIEGGKVAAGALERRVIASDSSPGVYLNTTMTERIRFNATTNEDDGALDVDLQAVIFNGHSSDVHIGGVITINDGSDGTGSFYYLLPHGIESTVKFRVTSDKLSSGTHSIKVFFRRFGARSGTPGGTDIEITNYDVTVQEVERVDVSSVTNATVTSGGSTSPPPYYNPGSGGVLP